MEKTEKIKANKTNNTVTKNIVVRLFISLFETVKAIGISAVVTNVLKITHLNVD